MTRLTFEEWWANSIQSHHDFCRRDYAIEAWEACEAAMKDEQAALVAGAYLDAAQTARNIKFRCHVEGDSILDALRSRTPADAKAAMERRDADKDALIEDLKFVRSQKDATIERLTAELAAAKQLAEKWMPDEENDLMEYEGDNHGDTAEAAFNRCLKSCAEQLLAAIDAAKGGSQP